MTTDNEKAANGLWERKSAPKTMLEQRFSSFPSSFSSLTEGAWRHFEEGAWIETSSQALLFGHDPDKAPHSFKICFYPPLSSEIVQRYEEIHKIFIPEQLAEFYRHTNGVQFYELSIYGIPPSMIEDRPTLNRGLRNALDISAAALRWVHGYGVVYPQYYHFASRNYGWDTQIGYFLLPDGSVCGRVKSPRPSECVDAGTWPSFDAWLVEALAETERFSPEHRAICAEQKSGNEAGLIQHVMRFFRK